MANWYISSVAYTAVAQWAASTTYATGAIVRQLSAPATNLERCFRVTAGGGGSSGSSEPTWVTSNNGTTTDNTLTWTECTGQEAHQHDNSVTNTWTAPAARHNCLTNATNGKNVQAAGDQFFYSSDHAETVAAATTYVTLGTTSAPNKYISVSRTTSNLPPLAADVTAGASLTTTGNFGQIFGSSYVNYVVGLTFNCATGANSAGLDLTGNTALYENCNFNLVETGSGNINFIGSTPLYGVTVQLAFGGTGQKLTNSSNNVTFIWENTSSVAAINSGGSTPTTFFTSGQSSNLRWRGLDLSLISGTLMSSLPSVGGLYNCKLNGSVTLPNSNAAAGINDIENHFESYQLRPR